MPTEDGATKDGDNEHMGDKLELWEMGARRRIWGQGGRDKLLAAPPCWCVSLGWDLGESWKRPRKKRMMKTAIVRKKLKRKRMTLEHIVGLEILSPYFPT